MTFRLPFKGLLEPMIMGFAVRNIHAFSARTDKAEYTADVCAEDYRRTYKIRHELRLGFDQCCADAQWKENKPRLCRQASRAMASLLYGPVEIELRDILEALWQAGMGDHPAVKRLEAMLPVLRGEGE